MDTRPSTGRPATRRGTVLPFLAITLVGMVGFLALAIDLGMVAIAKTQTQLAADLAALTAARTVNGDASIGYNQSKATTNAQNILTYNVIMGKAIQASQLQLSFGSYDYNDSTQTFNANFPATSGVPATAVAATVTSNGFKGAFSNFMGGQFLANVSSTAQAVHRPRDIAVVLDLSGSMRMGTCLGFEWYTSSRTSNNPDSLIPTFGHYSSSNAKLQGPTTNRTSAYEDYTISPTNTTATNASYSRTYVNNFYQNDAYKDPLVRAFDSYTSSDEGTTWSPPTSGTPVLPPSSYATVPGGDVPLFKNGSSSNYATNVSDVVGSSSRNASWELDGYSNYTSGTLSSAAVGLSKYPNIPDPTNPPPASFSGYTQGPGYYGKTFFLWPPDPRQPLVVPTSGSTQFTQFLTDFGFSSTERAGNPLKGLYSVTSTPGSHTWPWPYDDGNGTTLSNYLQNQVNKPGLSTKLTPSDSAYKSIMRLYSRSYAVDNLGTTPCDWRLRFFGTVDNNKLFTSSYTLDVPGSGTFTINYNEILRWIAQGPNPFPQQLRAGRVKYYGSIPTAITGTWPNYGNTDQRFWVEFIDYVLGFRQTSAGNYQDISDMTGYGSEFTWGTKQIGSTSPPSQTQYMGYTDNPARPGLRHWFGPMAMVDYLQNYNMDSNVSNYFYMQPGDSYEAPLYTAKQAYLAAVTTMQLNHPNDWVALVPYSWPRSSASATAGRFNAARSPLGTNYEYAKAALTFPLSTINADGSAKNTEITPYDADKATGRIPSADFVDTPRADGNTCFSMALMLCYNQFAVTPTTDTTLRSFVRSSPITFPTGIAGGLGRKGSQKVIIFETDGLPNTTATASLVNAGSYKYYKVRYDMNAPNGSEYPSVSAYGINDSTVLNQTYSLVQQLASTYQTPRNPFRLYAIGFGPVFEGTNSAWAQQTLQTMQYYAGTQSSASIPLASNQIITGTDAQMSANLVSTFTNILQSGVQVALIK